MKIPTRIICLSAALAATHPLPPIFAQDFRIGLTGGETVDALGHAGRGATLQSELIWSTPAATSRLGAFGSMTEGLGATAGLFGSGEAVLMRAGSLQLRLATAAAGAGSSQFLGGRGTSALSARIAGRHLGLEGGPLVQFAAERLGSRSTNPLGVGPRPLEGITSRHSLGGRAALLAAGGPVSSRLEWKQTTMDGARWTDWTVAFGADAGGGSIAVDLGRRMGGLEEQWAAVHLALPLGSTLQLTGQLGTYASDPVALRPAGRFASAGIVWASGPAVRGGGSPVRGVPMPAAIPAGITRLTMRAEPGARVELLADWAGWTPQTLQETSPGRYEIEVVLPPGVHRFAYQVNGEWTVPPDHPTESDDYGGRRALLRVE